jgi:hypothetical protein
LYPFPGLFLRPFFLLCRILAIPLQFADFAVACPPLHWDIHFHSPFPL